MRRILLTTLAAFTILTGCSSETTPASGGKTLTIYTYDAFAADWGPGPQLEAMFEERCDCDLVFTALDSSLGLLSRIRLEGTASKADIVLGLDTAIAAGGETRSLFASHGLSFADTRLHIKADDPLFVPFDWGAFAFVYNSERLSSPPTSFAELAALPGDVKIAIQDPRASTPGLGLLIWVRSLMGEEAGTYWKSLAPRILTVTKSWSDAYSLMTSGEADMVLSYTTSPAYHRIAENDHRYHAAQFVEGHLTQIEVAGILKSSGNKALAREFLTFLLSAEAQAVIPTTNWMYPAREIPLPEGFPDPPAHLIAPDREAIAAHRKTWVDEWLNALSL